MIPVAMIELDEAHAALGQPARQQAVRSEGAIAGLRRRRRRAPLRFLAHVHQVGHARLHPERHLVLRDAGLDLGIVRARCVRGGSAR